MFFHSKFKVLILYEKNLNNVGTVYDHLNSVGLENKKIIFYFLDINQSNNIKHESISKFDLVLIHYGVRLIYQKYINSLNYLLEKYEGIKFLFIQDEYDNTLLARRIIKELKINLVFTCVPKNGISKIYPPSIFKETKFVNVLTGYCPKAKYICFDDLSKSSERKYHIVYRGRELPLYYGSLGIDKVEIPNFFKSYAEINNYKVDIETNENSRIYGRKWLDFLSNSKATLATESGSNFFDWHGDKYLCESSVLNQLKIIPDKYSQINFIRNREFDKLMNQISPRVFEAIMMRTALVMKEGLYSGVLKPWLHYIPLKDDLSNIKQIFDVLNDHDFLDSITLSAYNDIVLSGKYNNSFLSELVHKQILEYLNKKSKKKFLKAWKKKISFIFLDSQYFTKTPIK